MTLHYFQLDVLEPEQDKRLRGIFGEGTAQQREGRGGRPPQFTPAVVEQMASEHESIGDFISALEAREAFKRVSAVGVK